MGPVKCGDLDLPAKSGGGKVYGKVKKDVVAVPLKNRMLFLLNIDQQRSRRAASRSVVALPAIGM